MPTAPHNDDAYNYAGRIRQGPLRQPEEFQKAMGLSNDRAGLQAWPQPVILPFENFFRQMETARGMFM